MKIVIALALVAPMIAQGQACPKGPGAALGISGYQCSDCGYESNKDSRYNYFFGTEPLVLSVTGPGQAGAPIYIIDGVRQDDLSGVRAGDFVVAVNGVPITTRDGAEQFVNPKPGRATVTVRRDSKRLDLSIVVPQPCPDERLRGDTIRLRTIVPPTRIDSVYQYTVNKLQRVIDVQDQRNSKFGFAIGCEPSCSKTKASDGAVYWKFDGYPPIAALRAGGPAEAAGLRVGDVVTDIDGLSILSEEGALHFRGAEKQASVNLTVLREGKKVGFLVRAKN